DPIKRCRSTSQNSLIAGYNALNLQATFRFHRFQLFWTLSNSATTASIKRVDGFRTTVWHIATRLRARSKRPAPFSMKREQGTPQVLKITNSLLLTSCCFLAAL